MNKHELHAILEKHGIPTHTWGQGETKTFNHLWEEVRSGEAVIEEHDTALVRVIHGSSVDVFYDGPASGVLHLTEERQVFADGRTRVRSLDTSIGEKRLPGETPAETARRALREELKITDDLRLVLTGTRLRGPVPSVSFPGLMTKYITDIFTVFLPHHLYRMDGYMERQPDKATYFVWKPYASAPHR